MAELVLVHGTTQSPAGFNALVAALAERGHRTLSGAAFRTEDRYVILYQSAATPGHQAHVVFHEFMHVLLGHLDGDGQGLSCRAVGETADTAEEDNGRPQAEWVAEAGATILTEWSSGDRRRRAQAGDDPAVLRFATALKGAAWT